MSEPPSLTAGIAERYARIALSHVVRPYPHKLDHGLTDTRDLQEPRVLHPVFYGSFDWHSCVHAHWLLARIYRVFADLPSREDIRARLSSQLRPDKVGGELAYLAQPMRAGFERPYGWAWLLMLAAELERHDSAEGRGWADAIRPLAAAFCARFLAFLPKATYPVRSGAHGNSAFALRLAIEYATVARNEQLRGSLVDTARAWFGTDADCQAWEPGGDDFLSPALIEAECMRVALGPPAFARWFQRFLPRLAKREPTTLFRPVVVSDRSDGKIAHLDGLNLSRAWCWRSLASSWARDDDRREIAIEAADLHLAASLDAVAGDFMGEHWLATFALLALESAPPG